MASRRAETAWPPPYDTDARYSGKHGMGWTGYKGHLTETVSDPADDDPDMGQPAVPNLVTDVQTTHAAVPDVVMTSQVYHNFPAAGHRPDRPAARYLPPGPDGGYTIEAFAIDWDRR